MSASARLRPLLATVLLLALAGCSPSKSAKPEAKPVPVEVAAVVQQDVPVELLAVGSVEPLTSVQLKAKVGGEVTKVNFTDGAYVTEGESLIQIDPRPYEVSVQRAEANVAVAAAQAKNAEDQLDRYAKLKKQGAASTEQFSQFSSSATQSSAETTAREADLAEARLSLAWTTVHAPITGRAGAALVKAGNIVQAETEILAVINQLHPIYVNFAIPESSLSTVRARLAAGDVPVEARDPDSGRTLQAGRIAFVDNAVDLQSGNITLKAVFANDDETLWPGQFVDVRVALDQDRNALVIPTTAVLDSQEGARVFVIKDSVARLRPVEARRTYGDLTVLKSGLEAGEQVVTNGQLRLIEGTRVSATTEPKKVALISGEKP